MKIFAHKIALDVMNDICFSVFTMTGKDIRLDIERRVWRSVERRLGLEYVKWDYANSRDWIGSMK